MAGGCVFCSIERGDAAAPVVFSDDLTVAFLDHRPVFVGHVLLIPRAHHATLPDLPGELVQPLFDRAQRLALAVQEAMHADGTFVAMNNTVSQSVPHLHVHIVPRRRKDGLRGFFWPRTKYESPQAMEEIRSRIAAAAS